ncbi:hypothetical protein SUGI_0471130 [Cryptomeria japonica]|nr:hypothetical protein SUGI_0471130 [Cryptomeria japonica]
MKGHAPLSPSLPLPALTPSAYALERARTTLAIWLIKKKDTQSQLEKCMSILRRMAEKLNVENKAGVAQAAININHAKAITILVCSTLSQLFPSRHPT